MLRVGAFGCPPPPSRHPTVARATEGPGSPPHQAVIPRSPAPAPGNAPVPVRPRDPDLRPHQAVIPRSPAPGQRNAPVPVRPRDPDLRPHQAVIPRSPAPGRGMPRCRRDRGTRIPEPTKPSSHGRPLRGPGMPRCRCDRGTRISAPPRIPRARSGGGMPRAPRHPAVSHGRPLRRPGMLRPPGSPNPQAVIPRSPAGRRPAIRILRCAQDDGGAKTRHPDPSLRSGRRQGVTRHPGPSLRSG
jgi:hypothetical protein